MIVEFPRPLGAPTHCACGAQLPAPVRKGGKPIKWCSEACRQRLSPGVRAAHERVAAAKRAQREATRAALGPRTCAVHGCEVDISDRDPRTVTCSKAHRVKLVRQRRQEAVAAG